MAVLALFLLLIVAGYLSRDYLHPYCLHLQNWIIENPRIAPLYFVLLSILAQILFIPRTTYVVFAGALFGTVTGVVYTMVITFVSGWILFYFARTRFRQKVERMLRARRLFHKLEKLSHRHGTFFVIVSRNLRVHFCVISFACGIFPIQTWEYLAGTFIGLLPSTIGYCWAASILGCTVLEPGFSIPFEMVWKFTLCSLLLGGLSLLPFFFDKKN